MVTTHILEMCRFFFVTELDPKNRHDQCVYHDGGLEDGVLQSILEASIEMDWIPAKNSNYPPVNKHTWLENPHPWRRKYIDSNGGCSIAEPGMLDYRSIILWGIQSKDIFDIRHFARNALPRIKSAVKG